MDRKKKFIKFVTLESPDSWKLLYYPGRIILLLITIIPTVYALYLSLHYYNLGKLRDKKFIFLQNYIELFQDE